MPRDTRDNRYYKTIKKASKHHNEKYFWSLFNKEELESFQINLLKELYTECSNGFKLFNMNWINKFLKGKLNMSFVDQHIKLTEYNEKLISDNPHLKKPTSANTLEKTILLYGEENGPKIFEGFDIGWGKQSNNNAFKHNGTHSPFSKKFKKYEKMSEKDSEEMRQISITKAAENREYNTRIEYYLNKGYSLEEAAGMLTERQTTFSLEICIEKFGEIEGRKIWNTRQINWQKTLSSKSDEEIADINLRKSSGTGNIKNHKNGKLYYVKYTTPNLVFWKIGITSKTLEQRLGKNLILSEKHNICYEKIFEMDGSVNQCYKAEQKILKTYHNNRIKVDIPGFCSTECFNMNVLEI